MKRSLVFSSALVFSVLALVMSTPFASRTVRADELKTQQCEACFRKVQKDYEKCIKEQGEETPFCGDTVFNPGIVGCFAMGCEG